MKGNPGWLFSRFPAIGGLRISTRILLIIGFCLIPTIGIQIAMSWSQWSERKVQTATLARQQAQLLSADVASIAEGVRLLLATASEFYQVRTMGPECANRLGSIHRNAPSLLFVAVVNRFGQILCASDPAIAATPNDVDWIRNAALAQSFVTGHFSRSVEQPGGFLPFYLPLKTNRPEDDKWLVGGLDLRWLREHFRQLKEGESPFLAATVLTVADSDGLVLGRNPNHDDFVGHRLPSAAMPILTGKQPDIIRLTSIDGTARVIGYVPPTSATHNLVTAAGFYEPDMMVDINRATWRNTALLGVVTVLAFAITWLVARRFINGPTQELVEVARKWRLGMLSSRAPAYDERSEFGQIAGAWNEMAAALQKRQDELEEHSSLLERRVGERTRDLLTTNNRLQVEIAEREKTQAALVQSQKLQAVGQLAGGIAHDFNNLLGTVQGSLDLLAHTLPAGETKQQIWLERASQAVLRGAQLTARLLAFSRRRHLSSDPTNVSQLIIDLAAMLEPSMLERQISVVTTLAPDLWLAISEPSQLEAALLNLALNARDAMPAGGVLTIAASNEILVSQTANADSAEYVLIKVTDTGIGMEPEIKTRAIEPFFTTKGAAGSGLGLSQVQAMVEEVGGTMRICSQPGEGTSVSLLLRRATEPLACPDTLSPELDVQAVHQRALVVDDDISVLQVTAEMLRLRGYSVLEATNGREALQRLEEWGQAPDLVILDYVMPEMNGVALAAAIRERGITAPILLATGYADLTEVGVTGTREFAAIINKPYTFADLQRILQRVVNPVRPAQSAREPTELMQ